MKLIAVIAHGVHSRRLSAYGNEWVETPHLDEFSARSAVFDRCFAPQPNADGFRRTVDPFLDSPGTTVFDDRRFGPPIATCGSVVSVPSGSVGGWLAAVRSALQSPLDGRSSTADATNVLWIETDCLLPPWSIDDELYQHYAEQAGGFTDDGEEVDVSDPWADPPIGPYEPIDETAHWRLHCAFAQALSAFDRDFGEFLAFREKHDRLRSAPLLFASGYGSALGEHEWIGPRGPLYEVRTAVPLMVGFPNEQWAGRRSYAFVTPADWVDAESRQLGGRLRAAIADPQERGLELVAGSATEGSAVQRFIRNREWNLLSTKEDGRTEHELFRKPEDLWEVNDLADRQHDCLEEMESLGRTLTECRLATDANANANTDSPMGDTAAAPSVENRPT